MWHTVHLVQLILEGNIQAIIIVSIPTAFVIWLLIHVYVLPARW